MYLGAAVCLSAASLAAQTATIHIDARQKLHRITPLFIGVNLEDLNFQTYGGLYSQLLHGEAFQEHGFAHRFGRHDRHPRSSSRAPS